jgi:hypothetical protein
MLLGKFNTGDTPGCRSARWLAERFKRGLIKPLQREYADGGAVVQWAAGFNAFEFPASESYAGLMSLHALDAERVTGGFMDDRQMLNAESLAMASSSRLPLGRSPATGQRPTTEVRLPSHTEFLLIRAGVTHVTKAQRRSEFDGHYLDGVRVVVTRRAPLPERTDSLAPYS